MKCKYGLLLALMLLVAGRAGAQDDVEYRMEIGAAAGLIGYHGDFNGSLIISIPIWVSRQICRTGS